MKIGSFSVGSKVCQGMLLAGAFLVSVAATKASPLSPGASLFPPPAEPDPIGGTVLQTVITPFSSATLNGTLISKVLSGDTSNPFGLGDLTFTYQIQVSLSSPNAVSQFSISRFDSFLIDASYLQLGTNFVAPSFISRSIEAGGAGNVIQFHFGAPVAESLLPGQTSDLLVLQTSSTNWQFTTGSIIDGVAVPNILSLAPLAVPEPTVAAFAIVGLGLLALRRSKSS